MSKEIVFLFTPGPMGGAEKIVLKGLSALRKRGHKAELWIIKEERVPHITQTFVELVEQENIPFKIIPCQKTIDFHLLRTLKRRFRRSRPALIHAHGFKATFYGKLAAPKKSRFIVTHHGKTGHTWKVRIYEWLELLMMRKADAVIAVSDTMKQKLVSSKVKSEKIHHIDNFLTTETKMKGVSDEKILQLIFVGRLSPEKGCESLINALIALKDPQIHLSILGDGSERQSLENLVRLHKLGSKIKFYGFQQDVASFMSKADALIMPSFREGQPLTLIEACCMGLPVLGSNVGGIPELVEHGRNGLLFQPGDIESIAKTIHLFKHQRQYLNQEAETSKDALVRRFSPEAWAGSTAYVYQTVLSHS